MKKIQTIREIVDFLKRQSPYAPVSVIMPCYNREKTIRNAVLSVMNQSWKPKELILINDGSTDGTEKIIEDLREKMDSDWIKIIILPKNMGPSVARNKGWEIANQPYLTFLDSDDTWNKDKIAIQTYYMLNNKEVFLSCTKYLLSKKNKEYDFSDLLFYEIPIRKITPMKLLFHNYFSSPGVMLKNNLSFRFPSSRRYSEDYHLWLNIAFSGQNMVFLNLPFAYGNKLYSGENGLSKELWKMVRDCNKNYLDLFRRKKIGFFMVCMAVFWGLLKLMIRVIITKFLKFYYKK